MKVAVFSGRDRHVGVFIDNAGSNIMSGDEWLYGRRESFGRTNIRIDGQELDNALRQSFGARRSENLNQIAPLKDPLRIEQRWQPKHMIAVPVCNKHPSDLAKIDASLDQPANRVLAGIDQIGCAVDDECVSALRAMGRGRGPPAVPRVITTVPTAGAIGAGACALPVDAHRAESATIAAPSATGTRAFNSGFRVFKEHLRFKMEFFIESFRSIEFTSLL